jgi:hypothetical protein
VDAWLRSVYKGQTVPDFEINQQTIDLLHAMATEYFQPSSRLLCRCFIHSTMSGVTSI